MAIDYAIWILTMQKFLIWTSKTTKKTCVDIKKWQPQLDDALLLLMNVVLK